MYKSAACWKYDKQVVAKELAKLSSKSAKLNALKENILIRVNRVAVGNGRDICGQRMEGNVRL